MTLRANDTTTIYRTKYINNLLCFINLFIHLTNPQFRIIIFLQEAEVGRRLTEAHRDFFNSSITVSELSHGISSMKNKAPVQDEIPSEFYKTFRDLLIKPLLTTCNNILLTEKKPKTWNDAKIIAFT